MQIQLVAGVRNRPLPYIREARRIHGDRNLTLEHLVDPFAVEQRELLQEAIAVGDYPVDHHRREDPRAPRIDFPAIPAFSIPIGTLLPKGVDGLIAAEKSISVSGLANGATRL
ncbi:MAG: FAD-dependent oxidoreductase, partial [Spirochaetes bacterium]|nr:FAD-dependent oxidoreductase [Spirochaetota bacterium]